MTDGKSSAGIHRVMLDFNAFLLHSGSELPEPSYGI